MDMFIPIGDLRIAMELEDIERAEVALQAFEVTVEVTNEGGRSGIETVQVYVSAPSSTVVRAPIELEGFAQIELAAGASGSVTIPVATSQLAFWDTATATWQIEATDYLVRAGSSSRHLPLETPVSVGP